MLHSSFQDKYSLVYIWVLFIILDTCAIVLIVLFVKPSSGYGFYQKNRTSDQIVLLKQSFDQDIDLIKLLDQLLEIDNLYKSEIIQLIKQYQNGTLKFYGPLRIIEGNSFLPENAKSIGVLIVKTRINDINHLNLSLLNFYNVIANHGIVILSYQSHDQAKYYNIFKNNRWLKYSLYPWYFIVTRAIPKIPLLEKLYFLLTNNKYLTISRAECWGRLHFTGFEVVGEREFTKKNLIIAVKSLTPSSVKKPSYYPIIKLRRVSLNGKIILIYKIRSMFPYSEFIQKKVFESGTLSTIGKFSGDFRITGYGRFIRKFYLDEIIQILNFLRGEIKIVGIRAMSEHYFCLYPEEYQRLYYQVKPGFFSPLPETEIVSFDDVVKLEQKYLEQSIKSPIKTDIKYFFKILFQIAFQNRVSS